MNAAQEPHAREDAMIFNRRRLLMASTAAAVAVAVGQARAAQPVERSLPMPVSVAEARAALAPSGRLRAAINYGNTVLAQRNAGTGELTGVTVVLARTLAERLGVPLEMIPFPAAGQVFEALEASPSAWDIAFMAVEPER